MGRDCISPWRRIIVGDEWRKIYTNRQKKKRKNSSTIKTPLDPRSIQEPRKCKRTKKEKEEKESNHLFIFSQLPFKPFWIMQESRKRTDNGIGNGEAQKEVEKGGKKKEGKRDNERVG